MKDLSIIVDRSGSMVEGAKRFIARYIVQSIEQYCQLGYGQAQLQLMAWNEKIELTDWKPGHEYPSLLLNCQGRANFEVLVQFMSSCTGKIILITDGYWSHHRYEDTSIMRIIKIGADHYPGLAGKQVYAAEDLFSALHSWL